MTDDRIAPSIDPSTAGAGATGTTAAGPAGATGTTAASPANTAVPASPAAAGAAPAYPQTAPAAGAASACPAPQSVCPTSALPADAAAAPAYPPPAPQPAYPTTAVAPTYPAPQPVYPAPWPPQTAVRLPDKPKTTAADAVFALGMLLAGLLFWEWDVIGSNYPSGGFGVSAFFLVLIAATWAYLHFRGIRQNRRSLVPLAVCCLGALPIGLYGGRDINLLLFLGEMLACLLWVAYSCKTTIKAKLSGLIVFDALRQGMFLPFRYFGWLFISIIRPLAKGGSRRGWRAARLVLVGLLIAVPLLAIVVFLLSRADDGFSQLVDRLTSWAQLSFFDNLSEYLLELILGLPVAGYVFGAVFGNLRRRLLANQYAASLATDPSASMPGGMGQTAAIQATVPHSLQMQSQVPGIGMPAERVEAQLARLRALPSLIVLIPLAGLVLIYLLFFIAMGSYQFSALQGELPESYTYAQYARRGFFELCGVASINLMLLGLVCLFARRHDHRLPLAVRLLTAAVSLLTCLLVVTAASKMLLYVDAYGLTELRLYTLWFMLLLLLVFLLIALWHLKPFNLARPIVLVFVALTLALALANTNSLIAQHNTDRYLSGQAESVDVDTLATLGDAGIDALQELSEKAPSVKVRNDAAQILEWRKPSPDEEFPWYKLSLQMLLSRSNRS